VSSQSKSFHYELSNYQVMYRKSSMICNQFLLNLSNYENKYSEEV